MSSASNPSALIVGFPCEVQCPGTFVPMGAVVENEIPDTNLSDMDDELLRVKLLRVYLMLSPVGTEESFDRCRPRFKTRDEFIQTLYGEWTRKQREYRDYTKFEADADKMRSILEGHAGCTIEAFRNDPNPRRLVFWNTDEKELWSAFPRALRESCMGKKDCVIYLSGHGFESGCNVQVFKDRSGTLVVRRDNLDVGMKCLYVEPQEREFYSKAFESSQEGHQSDYVQPGSIYAFTYGLLTPHLLLPRNLHYINSPHGVDLSPLESSQDGGVLILIIDACHSGYWVEFLRENWKTRFNDFKGRLIVQAACSAEEQAEGGYFVGLFEELQLWDSESLKKIRNVELDATNFPFPLQFPTFFDSEPSKEPPVKHSPDVCFPEYEFNPSYVEKGNHKKSRPSPRFLRFFNCAHCFEKFVSVAPKIEGQGRRGSPKRPLYGQCSEEVKSEIRDVDDSTQTPRMLSFRLRTYRLRDARENARKRIQGENVTYRGKGGAPGPMIVACYTTAAEGADKSSGTIFQVHIHFHEMEWVDPVNADIIPICVTYCKLEEVPLDNLYQNAAARLNDPNRWSGQPWRFRDDSDPDDVLYLEGKNKWETSTILRRGDNLRFTSTEFSSRNLWKQIKKIYNNAVNGNSINFPSHYGKENMLDDSFGENNVRNVTNLRNHFETWGSDINETVVMWNMKRMFPVETFVDGMPFTLTRSRTRSDWLRLPPSMYIGDAPPSSSGDDDQDP